MREDLKQRIWELVEVPIIKKNFELVDLEWRREPSGWVLRLYIDKPGGVTISDCAKISEIIGKLLDKEDLIHHPYNLEVSSPGIFRPLKTKEHFERFKGEKAKITLNNPLGNRKNFLGIIRGVKGETLEFEVEGKVIEIDLKNIKKANLQREITFK
ncbi:MAG: ribosome maturation factor RimP [Caldimicrobium sp.]|nr:ribosome maturation factor RimP [Caldimicrobium sp.]MCX7873845.1 ribosome maturation factor RimP [Caldimicrobium sp.]